jgi:riboflavin biosynthesis pyrimidine reductase
MRRVVPTPTVELTVEDAYGTALGSAADRPWVTLSMVSSIDGSTAVGGASGGLGNDNDSAILARLRQVADVIVVGASTVRAERYGPPSKPGQRIGVVTGSGRVDTATELFTSGSGFVVTSERAPQFPDHVDVLRCGSGQVDLVTALQRLPALCGPVEVVQCEGGPTLNGAFLDADLVDEINVTTAAVAVGGDGRRLISGAAETSSTFDLAQLAVDDSGFTFARWRRAG